MGSSRKESGQEKHRGGMPTGDAQTGRATKTAAGGRPNLLGGRPEDPKTPKTLRYGLGFYVAKELLDNLVGTVWVSNRIAVLRLRRPTSGQGRPVSTFSIINVYAPTAQRSQGRRGAEERSRFYDQLRTTYADCKRKSTWVAIAGDWNSKLGTRQRDSEGVMETFMGKFGKGTRNANGECLASFLSTTGLYATNTKFQHPMRHRSTWGGLIKKDGILTQYFNQIDYIMVDKKFRNSLKDARAYNGQDFSSDYSLLVTTIRMNELFTMFIRDTRQRGTLTGQEEAWPRNGKRYIGIGRKLTLRAFGLSQKISDNYKENLAAQLNVDCITEEEATSTTEELQRVAQADAASEGEALQRQGRISGR